MLKKLQSIMESDQGDCKIIYGKIHGMKEMEKR